MNRRCLTLLEVLIALALLAGLAALVLPSMLDRLDERAFEAAADTASEQLMMARAHAQATGEAVEVTYSPKTRAVQARVYAAWSSELEGESIDGAAAAPARSPDAPNLASARGDEAAPARGQQPGERHDPLGAIGLPTPELRAAQGRVIAEAWASRVLGRGIRLQLHPPTAEEHKAILPSFTSARADERPAGFDDAAPASGIAGAARLDDFETLEDLERGQEVRLAVYMPDGSALVGDDLWLNDDKGRCGRLRINPWSGLPMFERLASLTAALSAQTPDADQSDPAAATPGDRDAGRWNDDSMLRDWIHEGDDDSAPDRNDQNEDDGDDDDQDQFD